MPQAYDLLSNTSKEEFSSVDSGSEEQCEEERFTRPAASHYSWLHVLWAIFFFLLGALVPSILLLSRLGSTSSSCSFHNETVIATPQSSYEKGYEGEGLLPASLIEIEQRRFVTPIDFRISDGSQYLVTRPGEIMYASEPSPAVDKAWHDLTWGRYFSISEDEAKSLWGEGYEDFRDRDRGGFTGGFDMFHQLHCLNQIRQALRRDYYAETFIHGPVHLEHCINHIRQAIQCWGNTAVTPIIWFEGLHHGYVKADVVHTCRKWEPIREFVSQRFNGSLAVPRPDGPVLEIDHGF